MKFVFLGIDSATSALAAAIQRMPAHEIEAVYLTGAETNADELLAPLSITAKALGDAGSQFSAQSNTPVVVSGSGYDPQQRAVLLRDLTQQGVPMLLAHPSCEAIVAFELDMIEQSIDCILAPYTPGLHHPGFAELRSFLVNSQQSPIGAVQQIIWERRLKRPSREEVLRTFSRDVLLLRRIVGEVVSVHAVGIDETLQTLNVHLASEEGVETRWNVVNGDEGATIKILGDGGELTLELSSQSHDSNGNESQPNFQMQIGDEKPDWNDAETTIENFTAQIAGEPSPHTWLDACRASDITDAVLESLRRRRAIPLYNERTTETETFKGAMAMGGCFFLLLTFFLFVGAMFIDGFDPPFRRSIFWRYWPLYVMAPMGIFLLSQLFLLIAKAKPNLPQQDSTEA